MANPLPDEIKVKIAEYVAKRPFRKDQFLDKFKQRGYDVSEFEDPTNTIQDNIAAFTAGIPEGATYGLVDLEEYGKDAGTVDLPLLGEVQPAREAGRLLGGMATGGALFKTGMRVGVPTGKRVVDSLLKRGITGKTAGVVGKVSEIATASTPEAVLGSLAHTYRADDLSELDNSFAEWMALGIGSEILGRKVMKYLARRKVPGVGSTDNILEEGNAVREEVKTELENQMDLDAPDGGAQEILSNTDAYGESLVPGVPPDFDQMPMDVRAMNDPDRTTMALTDAESVKQMESMNDSAVLRHDKESGRVDDIVLPDSNVISPKMGWSFGGQGKSFPVEEFTAIKSNTGLGEWDGEIYFNNKRSLKDNIVGTVRVTAGKDPKKVVFVDEKNLKSLYDNPDSYKHSQGGVYGVSGGFDTIDDLRDFVIAHEIEHFRHPYLTWKNWYGGSKDVKKKALAAEESGITNYEVDTSKAAYENWVNKLALDTRAKAKEKGKRIAVTDKPENPTETPRFEEGNRNHNNFSEKTDAKLGIKRSNDLQQQSEFSPNDMGESGRAISPSGKQTIEGTVIDTAEDAVMIRNDKTGKDRWYRTSKGWKISVTGRPIQEAAEALKQDVPFVPKKGYKPDLEPSAEWKGELYHGTESINLETMIDPTTKELTLMPGSNFGGKTHGISFTSSYAEAKDYASRVKLPNSEQVGSMRDTRGPVVAIKRKALSNLRQQTDTEWDFDSGGNPSNYVKIKEGDYRVIDSPNYRVSKYEDADFETVARAMLRDNALSEAAEARMYTGGDVVDLAFGPEISKLAQRKLNENPTENWAIWERLAADQRLSPYDPSNFLTRPSRQGTSEPSNFPFTSTPTQVGGASPATAEQRERLAGLINAIRQDDTLNEMHSLEFLPDNITVASANEHIDRLTEDLITVKTRRNSRAINDIDRMAEAGNSRRFGNDPVQNPPLQEYADMEIPEDVQRKARGPLHTLFRKFWVPTSKVLGFGSHPMSAMAIRNTVRLTVEKQSLEGKWMDYVQGGDTLQNIEELITGSPHNANILDQISGKVQRDIKNEDTKKLFYDFFNVVEDMNNGAPRATAIKAYPSMAKNPNINEAIDMHLRLTNSIADDLGLGKNKRISYYIPHIFSDRSGEYVAASVSNTMDNASNRKLKSMMEDFGADAPIESPEAPSRGFRHLRKREANLDHFEHDYQQVMSMYIRGASAKITNDKIAQHGRSAMLKLVSEGNQDIAEDLSKYLRYAMGMPTDFRQKVAHVFSDSHVFNSTVDRLVGFIGGKDAAILQRARLNPNDSELMFESRKWMNELDDMTRLRDRVTGDKKEKAALKKIRGVLAKRIDDTRNAANNPYMAASTSNFLYRTQIVAKLGLNIAHGMINQTQILTNVLAMLKAKNVAWGYAHTVFGVGKDKTFNGRNISDLIAESGISRDVGRQQEFLDGPAGSLKYLQDKSMFIAKYSEEVNRETTLLAAYKEYIEMGDGHGASLHKARELVEETHFSFSRAGTAPILRSPVGRLFLMFKSYPMHQTDFTLGLVAKALTKGHDGKRFSNSDDYAPLVKHAIAYATLIGGGAYALPGTNISDRTTPPAYDIPADMVKDSGRYGLPGSVIKNLMGPFGDTMTKVTGMMTSLIDGGMEQANHKALRAAQSFALPSTVRRLYGEEIDAGNLLKGKKYDWLYFTGLKKYDPDENKKSRATGGISPLQSLGLGN